MGIAVRSHILARDANVVRVDFHREPDPPAPRFPGAGALRISSEHEEDFEATLRPFVHVMPALVAGVTAA